MKYRVTIEEEIEKPEDKRYLSYKSIYKQTVDDLNVIDVIKAVNKMAEKLLF